MIELEQLGFTKQELQEQALESANKSIAQGIYETARIKLNEIAAKLKVTVSN